MNRVTLIAISPATLDRICAMKNPRIPRKTIVHFEVATEAQAAELDAAWREILAGKRTRIGTAAEDTLEIMERAGPALEMIVKAIEDHPGTGQSRRLVRFLAGVYNGGEYPFDLTDLRALDTELANACIDYLNYDRLGKVEVHTHLPGGGEQMQWFIAQHGIRRRLRLSGEEKHEERLEVLADRLRRDPDSLLKQALDYLLKDYEAKHYGGLAASQPSPDGDRPLVHARLLTDAEIKPLCGASDGPWSPRTFEFSRITCWECQAIVLKPADHSE
jgi:predicted transcriptional regulator